MAPAKQDEILPIDAIVELPAIRAIRHAIRLRHQAYLDSLDAREKPTSWSQANSYELDLVQLPHALAAAFDALCRAEAAQVELAAITPGTAPAGTRTYGVHPHDAYAFSFAIDSYLESAVRAQNGTWRYISKALAISSSPSSLHDAVNKLRKKKGIKGVSPDIAANVLNYWDTGGERLRDYRDLSQHFAVVASDLSVWYPTDSVPMMWAALPSNPKHKKAVDIRYNDPIVLAFPYCADTFVAMLRWLQELATLVAPDILEGSRNAMRSVSGPIPVGDRLVGYPVGHRGAFAEAIAELISPKRIALTRALEAVQEATGIELTLPGRTITDSEAGEVAATLQKLRTGKFEGFGGAVRIELSRETAQAFLIHRRDPTNHDPFIITDEEIVDLFGTRISLGEVTLAMSGAYLTDEQAAEVEIALNGATSTVAAILTVPADCKLTATYAQWPK